MCFKIASVCRRAVSSHRSPEHIHTERDTVDALAGAILPEILVLATPSYSYRSEAEQRHTSSNAEEKFPWFQTTLRLC